MRDTAEVFDHHAIDADVVVEQARSILEDVTIAAWKVGFLGSTEGVSAVAEILSDYPDVPLVAYMPNLSWVEEDEQQAYLDAFRELVLPQTEVLVGSHQTLTDFLLPDWDSERPASPRELAVAAGEHGTRFVLVTERAAARPVPRQRAGLAAGRRSPARSSSASRSRSSAPATRCRPRWPRCWPPAPSCTRRSARRWPSSTRRSTRASAPAWATSIPDRFFWALPAGDEEGDGDGEGDGARASAAADDAATRAEEPAPCPLTALTPTANAALFERAQRVIPGGVNSPVRAFRAVGGTPRFIARAEGAVHRRRRRHGATSTTSAPGAR